MELVPRFATGIIPLNNSFIILIFFDAIFSKKSIHVLTHIL